MDRELPTYRQNCEQFRSVLSGSVRATGRLHVETLILGQAAPRLTSVPFWYVYVRQGVRCPVTVEG